MYNITIVERMLLNSIVNNYKSIDDIESDTGLKKSYIQHLLKEFSAKGIIEIDQDKYKISNNLCTEQVEMLTNPESLKVEHALIAKGIIQNSDNFKLQKFYLSKKDQHILKGMLKSIELFIEGAKIKSDHLKNETILFWGSDSYKNISQNSLLN